MDIDALAKKFSQQPLNRKGKAKRDLRRKKSYPRGDKPQYPRGDKRVDSLVERKIVDYDKSLFDRRRDYIKYGPYSEFELDEVSDGNTDEDCGKHESIKLSNEETADIIFRHPDDDKMIEFSYFTEVDGKYKGLSDELVAMSFPVGTKGHLKRFKRVLDWQIPQEVEFLEECPSLEKYHSEVLMSETGRVQFAYFSV